VLQLLDVPYVLVFKRNSRGVLSGFGGRLGVLRDVHPPRKRSRFLANRATFLARRRAFVTRKRFARTRGVRPGIRRVRATFRFK
jgi:hypothetical protein